jgi:hypothetical protein
MTMSTVTAGPWDQLLPRDAVSVLKGTDTSLRRVRSGKLQAGTKNPLNRDRGLFSRAFCRQLEQNLVKRARELDDLWDQGVVSKDVAELIAQIFNAACSAIEAILKHKKAGAPPTLRRAKGLLRELQRFQHNIDLTLTHDLPGALDLALSLQDLCDDIAHYIRQIGITFAIDNVTVDRQAKPANRPTNWDAKAALAEIVHNHQRQYGTGTLPKPRQATSQLQQAKHHIPDRTLRQWYAQMKSGTFGNYVQDRKRQ